MDPLEVIINGEKKAVIDIDPDNGLLIFPANNVNFTRKEIHLLTSIAFIYIGTHERDMILEPETVVELGLNLYNSFYSNYDGFKNFHDMSLKDFNEEIKKYDGRK